ncbi:SLAM family member 5 isoform X5 [Ovis aries]|uniref:SLAM family member 5 isoform X5 n=1 Tax=Ovis aries TaxID=9940 RepID=UPI001C2E6E62|nr:SLAM family member 5 isoform X5 [Ovis aries]XP_060271200.1 SLAM family member 5 isoform X5 [Ovis aries]
MSCCVQKFIVKKMAHHHLWILLFCLQTCLEAAGSDTDIFIVNGILGESATFPLNIQPSQKVTFISWHSKTSVAFVTPGNFGEEPIVTITHQNYHERINVSGQNYNLELRNLKIEDSGIYKADINVETSKTTTTRSYNLQVYRRLGKPKITQSFVTSVNSTCNATLMCSVDKEEKNVTYSWSPRGEAGNVLQIFQTPDNQEETYTCTAWNPVSNNSDSISAQQLCTDITMSPHIHRTGLMSGLAVLSLLIIILSVVLFLLCKKEGRIFSRVLHLTISQKDGPDYYILNGLPNMFLGSAGCHGSRTWVQVCVSSFLNNFSKNPGAPHQGGASEHNLLHDAVL